MHWQHVPLGAAVASTVWLLVQHFRGSGGKSAGTRQVGVGVCAMLWPAADVSVSHNALT
jgi:hypothetical protein